MMRSSLARAMIVCTLTFLTSTLPAPAIAHGNTVAAELDAARHHLLDEVLPATYFIHRSYTVAVPGMKDPIGPFNSFGSGFGVTKEGLIITNAHVVRPMNPSLPPPELFGGNKFKFVDGAVATVVITVTDHNGNTYAATVVALDGVIDLALVDIQKQGEQRTFPVVEWATDIKPGDAVISIGAPYGFRESLGDGIVSKIESDPENGVDHLRSNAMTHPGNSGGPLVRLRDHKVVGVNAMTFVPMEIGENDRPFGIGIGWAISAETCLKFIERSLRQNP